MGLAMTARGLLLPLAASRELVTAPGEPSEVSRRFVERPAVDDRRAVHPDPDAVVADGAKSVVAGRERHRGRRVERPALLGQLAEQRAVPLVVEPAGAPLEKRCRAEQRGERLGISPRVSAVAPGEEARGPVLGGLEAAEGEAVRHAGGPALSAG